MACTRLSLFMAAALALACGRSSPSDSPGSPTTEDRARDATAGAEKQPGEPSAPSDDSPTLTARMDLELEVDEPTPVAELDLEVTLLSADRVRTEHSGGIGHVDRAVIRFERPGEDPIVETFGPGGLVTSIAGHSMAVFGGRVLSIFPPGMPVVP